MPKMNGDEAAKILREKGVTIPIIALSAGAVSDIGDKKVKAVFDSFLAKPVDSRKLYNTICNYLPNIGTVKLQGEMEKTLEDVIDFSDGLHAAVELTEDNEPIWVKKKNV